ncbi:MAG TPA: pyridoxal-phosphate dependent enzyme [Ramlibacter sp.]|nr:pyridoxal-phosphate dependent enzyme [Ramlibacter sp.]
MPIDTPRLRHAEPLRWNPALEGLRCLACGRLEPVRLWHSGCSACAARGVHVSLAASYIEGAKAGVSLPFFGAGSLGEGATPCRDLPALARALGVARLQVKDESRNPTGSHKDRMSAFGTAHAQLAGVRTVVLASSGNAAVSAAAYAAAAGLACEVATYDGMPLPYVRELERLGAVRHSFPDNDARWRFVAERARSDDVLALTNHQLPALGSAPLAIEGYKLLAQEIAEAGELPHHVVVPTSRGDLVWGIWRGLRELLAGGRITEMPRLWVSEPIARLSRVLQGEPLHGSYPGVSAQFSTGGHTVTWLQHEAATGSEGGAVFVPDDQARRARWDLREHGLSPELCAAGTLAAAWQLVRSGRIQRDERVLLVLTAASTRDPSWPDPGLPASLFDQPTTGVAA